MASQAKLSRIAINKILLATDFSSEAQNALQSAIGLAKRYESTLFLAHALPMESSLATAESWPVMTDVLRHNAEACMAKAESAEGLQFLPHEIVIRAGDPWGVVSQVLSEEHIDLIVMGTHGEGGIKKLFVGSTAEKIIRHSGCPVLTVGPHVQVTSQGRFGHVFYATDFSTGSLRALHYALSLAEEDRAEFTMLHIIQSKPASEAQLLEWKRQAHEKLNAMVPPDLDLAFKPEIEVEVGTPQTEILRLADTRKAELIVMGSHAAGAASTHLPWSTLHHVLQHAHCPVLTVRGA